MTELYLMLGSNIGDRQENLRHAANLIHCHIGAVQKKSQLYETAPWGILEQESFVNQALLVQTKMKTDELIDQLQRIERYLGKTKIEKYGPRLIDIDVLFYGDEIIETLDLHVPHPRMTERKFVLIPLSEIAPNKVHPLKNKTIDELNQQCIDEGAVSLLQNL